MLKFAKFIGANTDFSTAQAYLFPRVLIEEPGAPVFGLLVSGEGEDIFIYVRQRILNLEDSFSAPFERVTEKLHELGETIKAELPQVEDLKFTLFCTKDNVFYVYQHGNNIVELLRGGVSNPVFQDVNSQEKVISGFLQTGDRILILSSKTGEVNWTKEIFEQVFRLPVDDIDDAEMIFAASELKSENQEDLAGVKNIEPVAFILIENPTPHGEPVINIPQASGGRLPKINFKFKVPSFNLFLYLHRVSRRLFAVLRRTNKKLLAVILILTLLLIIGGSVYLFLQGRGLQKNQRLNNLVTSIEKDLGDAGSLKDSDAKQAAEKISQAKSKLSEAAGLSKDDSKIAELSGKIEEKEAEVLKIYKNFNLELFMSLDLIKEKFNAERFSFSVDRILVMDTNEKSVISIDTELKTTSIIAGRQQLGDVRMVSLNGSHGFSYSGDKGIVHVDVDTRKASVVAKPDPEWGNIADIFGFSGNVYVLDTGKNQIWKYAPTENGFSEKQEYLKSSTAIGLGKKLVIDYSVWVLTSEPEIYKFTAGNEDYFALSGLNEPLAQIDNIFVPEELDSIFILDKSTNRILVTKKNGEYLAQYISPEFSKVSDFFIDETQKLIYLLIENKIYTTPLR